MNTIKTIPQAVAALIPFGQYAVTEKHLDAYADAIERLEKQLTKCPEIGGTDGMKEHPAIFHYFFGGTDMYFCEYDRKNGILYGFINLKGDLQNAEWGYVNLEQIITIPIMNIDYYLEEQSIEAALYKKYPHHFRKPQSVEK